MKKALVRTLFASLVILGCSASASENSDFELESINEEHVIVNSRPLSPSTKQIMEETRSDEYAEESSEESSVELSGLIIPIKHQNLVSFASNSYTCTAANFSPSIYHWVDDFPQENILRIEDGSEWIFDIADAQVVRNWRQGDTIVVSPKSSWVFGSNFAYNMTNKDTGTTVSVNLFLGPIAFGSYSTWIVGIDYNMGQVYLLDGQGERSVWEIAPSDLYLFKEWAVNDTLIMGENDSYWWLFSDFNHVFVNVNMNHFVRARQVSATPHYRLQAMRG